MSQINASLPLLGFAAFSGTGKTTLLEAMLPKLVERGLRVAVVKHAHHNFDIDQEGKDSYRLRKAGASQMLISSRYRHALVTETPEEEVQLPYLLNQLDQTELDLILVEGFKKLDFPKIELHRKEVGKPWLHPEDNNIIAIAANIPAESALPQMDINNLDQITDFVIDYVKSSTNTEAQTLSCSDINPAGMLSVTQGREKILEQIKPLHNSESVNLHQALGQIVAHDILSPVNVPQHTNSAMDGYAISGDDIERESYHVVGQVLAGHSYDKPLEHGEAVRIMTGAPVPQGADTVIMREQAAQKGDTVTFDKTMGNIKAGQNVRQAGEDLALGQIAVASGTTITAPELGMVASLGIDKITINKPIRVAIFSTGDEVQQPGETQKQNCIYDSNRYTLYALLTNLGCEVIDLGIIDDNEASLEKTLTQASTKADLILSSGGVSVGDADYIKTVLDKLGKINFWRINMRPGRPLAFGTIGNVPFFGLPGNPVAVMVAFLQFVEPAIRKQQGIINWQPKTHQAITIEKLRSRSGRTEYTRGISSFDANGRLVVKSTGSQGSGILRSMSEANCLIEIAPEQVTAEIGDKVTIIPLDIRM
ncbi:bifunctional molybdopterin-guanine dinucleotide biosynthesis adaptor protein MobB/molybdopterin molybdotransferase MoeA [Photobacterium angustum]|uniref:bifunctional molybdopterin-guanine dinucleotide biosynthesis adaptor protein MobB/molybdopterin molybdotransferase MoeA n=1 Tax=Photobacterium angustum TaxID=661 RepID=UPI0005E9CF9D|nr:bifunctional molybdopterin-guanine dinucleotide biosynthesis adaptor protein MobB/molybdopterin molybdotransferase MoeA [Photobacterium angustum]KJG19108.1 molybdopterin-guanine dinucleotide biosynthesis protein MobB [Photobacterium angustum]KJG25202.1 molybdopterin-guanine dinucleotide biosynthesis protein MobB [Photobacterium angustum]KJG33508.1 molybdopterin-guanine dinucleotide biosynthesis protein MobB [Photobacterium angustum]PSW96092.1 bifunctional molybdopterin-guanine dinucleotide b